MMDLTFRGDSIQDLATQAKKFAEQVLEGNRSGIADETSQDVEVDEIWGYRPGGVGNPKPQFSPVDNGEEWNSNSLEDWLDGCNDKVLKVIKILAEKQVIDPREEYSRLGLSGNEWSGMWNGPRNQAERVKNNRGLRSWPYGHTYEEPRRLWMHPKIAHEVLDILGQKGF